MRPVRLRVEKLGVIPRSGGGAGLRASSCSRSQGRPAPANRPFSMRSFLRFTARRLGSGLILPE